MDEFSLFVLEDTLQFATEVLPSELISDSVACIRDQINVVALNPADYLSARRLHLALTKLSAIAREHNRLVVQMRLESIARQFELPNAA